MPIRGRGISEYRPITIQFNDAVGQDIVDQTAQVGSGIDAYKAAIGKAELIEADFNKRGLFNATTNPAGLANVTSKVTLVTGALLNKIYIFELTTDVVAGVYTFLFVEERPNALNEA